MEGLGEPTLDPHATSSQLMEQSLMLEIYPYTLETLSWVHTVAMATRLDVNTWLTLGEMRLRLARHIVFLLSDDQQLLPLLPSLPLIHLQQACLDRGLKVVGLNRDELALQLSEWLKFSLSKPHLITPLLIHAHGFTPRDFILAPVPPKQPL
jgi:hypothetical protein